MPKDIVIVPESGKIELSGSSTHINELNVHSGSVQLTGSLQLSGSGPHQILGFPAAANQKPKIIMQDPGTGTDYVMHISGGDSNRNVVRIDSSYSNTAGSGQALYVKGTAAYGTPGSATKAYGGFFLAGATNGNNPDTIALMAQADTDGPPNSYAAIFSGSSGGVVGINTMEPTKELEVKGDISASGDLFVQSHIILGSGGSSISDDAGGISFGTPGDDHGHIYDDGDKLVLGYNDSDKVMIHDTGTTVQIEGNLQTTTAAGHITASGNVKVAGNILANGNIIGDNSTDISGIDSITANSLNVTHFTSSFITSSTIVTEGSNTFGDTSADTHTFVGNITASGNISASGKIITSELSALGDLTIDADGADILLKDGGTSFGRFKRDSSDFVIKAESNNNDIIFKGQDGGATITALTLDMSEAGSATFNSHITASNNISASGDVITNRLRTNTIKPLDAGGGNLSVLTIGDSDEGANATKFVIDDNNEQAYITSADTDTFALGVNTTTPTDGYLEVKGNISASGDFFSPKFSSNNGNITASGNISSSEYFYGERFITPDNGRVTVGVTAITYSDPELRFGYHTGASIRIGKTTSGSPTTIVGNITASGHISSSGTIKGTTFFVNGQINTSDGRLYENGSIPLVIGNSPTAINLANAPTNFAGNVTASGAISGSTEVKVSNLRVDANQFIYYDESNDFGWRTFDPVAGTGRIMMNKIGGVGGLMSMSGSSGGRAFVAINNGIAGVFPVEGLTIKGQLSSSREINAGTTADSDGNSIHTFGGVFTSGNAQGSPSGSMIRVGADAMGSASLELYTSNKGWTFKTSKNHPSFTDAGALRIIANRTTDVMTLALGGNVGIGNIAPSKELTVTGDISASGAIYVGTTEIVDNGGNINNRFQLSYDYNGRVTSANKWMTKSDRGGFANYSLQLATSNPSGTAVTYLAAARYSSYTAPRACKLIRMQSIMLNYTNDDDIKIGVYKGTAVNDSNSTITITQIGSDIGGSMDEDKTYMNQTDFSSGNDLAAGDFLLFTIHSTSVSTTSYPRFSLNLELQYT